MYELDAPTCTYMILQYGPEWPARLVASQVGQTERPDGRVLYVAIMDEDFVGEAIEVSAKRARGVKEDPVMTEIERQLHEMLRISPLAESKTEVEPLEPGQDVGKDAVQVGSRDST